MVKTRRGRKQKRSRKYTGGKRITVKAPSMSKKDYNYNATNEKTTAREIVQYYFDKENFISALEENIRSEHPKTNLMVSSRQGTRRLNLKGKWNEGRTFEEGEVYTIIPHLFRIQQEKLEKETYAVVEWIKKYMTKMKKLGGGKIILGSSTATDDIPKNVRQQFHFHTDPKMPILHIDSGFFTPNHEPNQFYNMVNINDTKWPEFAYGPRSLFRVYQKPAGVPLRPLSDSPKQVEYFEEVQRQAARNFNLNDTILIACAKLQLSDSTEKEIREFAAENGIAVYTWSD